MMSLDEIERLRGRVEEQLSKALRERRVLDELIVSQRANLVFLDEELVRVRDVSTARERVK